MERITWFGKQKGLTVGSSVLPKPVEGGHMRSTYPSINSLILLVEEAYLGGKGHTKDVDSTTNELANRSLFMVTISSKRRPWKGCDTPH